MQTVDSDIQYARALVSVQAFLFVKSQKLKNA